MEQPQNNSRKDINKPTTENSALMGELETLRRKYKEALELASRQALLLDQTHDALFAWDLDGHIKIWNRAATKLYGWSEEQALGRDVQLLLGTEPPLSKEEILAVLKGGKYWAGEVRRKTQSGETIWVDVRIYLSETPEGPLVVSCNHDITIQKQTAKKLLDAEEHFRQLVQAVEDYAIFTLSPEGYITTWNAGLKRLNEYTAEDVLGKHISFLYTPEDVAKGVPESDLREAEEKNRCRTEGWRVRKNGTRLFMDVVTTAVRDSSGRLTGFTRVARDVTERRQAEITIRERNSRLELISDFLSQILSHRDPDEIMRDLFSRVKEHIAADIYFVYDVNLEAKELKLRDSLGIPDELNSKIQTLSFEDSPCGDIIENRTIVVCNDILSSSSQKMALCRAAGGKSYVGVPLIAGQRIFGTLGFISKTKNEFTGDDIDFVQVIAGYICIALDHIQSEKKVLEAKNRAEEASNAKDEFMATLSHELRTPLTPALMLTTAMEEDQAIATPVRQQIGVVRHSVQLEARLIDDLLDVTRIARGKFTLRPEVFDLHKAIDGALEIVKEDIREAQLTLELKANANPSRVIADRARIEQVIWNLLKNAIKFTPPGGRITILTGNFQPDQISIEIQDTGIGIAPENLQGIFKPFEQVTKRDYKHGGLGLGLAICDSIVRLHQGTIEAESPGLEKGATFRVLLPLYKGTEEEPPASMIPPKNAASALRILLVEDHKETRAIMRRLLSRDGHDVLAVGTVTEALDTAESAGNFDVLLCDIGLPDGSGYDVVRKVKAINPDTTAIALSGYGSSEDVVRSIGAGFNVHLTKPVSIDALREALGTRS